MTADAVWMHPDRYASMLEHRPVDVTDEQVAEFHRTAILSDQIPMCVMVFFYPEPETGMTIARIVHFHPGESDGGYYDEQQVERDGVDGGTPMSLDDLLGDEVAELIRANKLPGH